MILMDAVQLLLVDWDTSRYEINIDELVQVEWLQDVLVEDALNAFHMGFIIGAE